MKSEDRTVVLDNKGVPTGTPVAPGAGTSAHLLQVNGPAGGSRFPLHGEIARWTLGRDDDRNLRLAHDPFISGRHAELQQDAQGHVLVDVFSANGTFLNFSRVPRGGRVPLKLGDVIGLGHTYLVYQHD